MALAAVHGVDGVVVGRADGLVPAVEAARAAGGVRLVVVRTDRAHNVRVHDELHAAVASRIEGTAR
jgi:adenine/guanine phosphoribosyltransferase-like PRPP-binding protein